jgi:hypothetical protein
VRLDARPGQQPPGAVAVIAPVGVQRVGQPLGTARLAPTFGKSSTGGIICWWSLALAPAVRMAKGTPPRTR